MLTAAGFESIVDEKGRMSYSGPMARISLRGVLAFFDGEMPGGRAHSNALNALLGEELGLSLLLHALRTHGASDVVVLDEPCTQGRSSGVRLDRWVRARRAGRSLLFQVEVKNWCAHSLGGRTLAVDADHATVAAHAAATWRRYWDEGERRPEPEQLRKVLVPMRVPPSAGDCDVEPVACVWDVLHPRGEPTAWFDVPASGAFPHLNWFSMSAHLRTLLRAGTSELELPLPQLEQRFATVGRLVVDMRTGAPSPSP